MSTRTMPAVVQYALEPGGVELRERPTPEPAPGEVVLRVGAVGVCGSDVHQLHGTQSWAVNVPVVLGHEFAGTVAAAPAGAAFREGDRVVSETAARICGHCALCRSGAYNLCPERLGFGYGADGAMAVEVAVPERCLHPIPDALAWEVAALAEPSCVAYTAIVERCELRPGDTVLVLGPGPIGLLCLLLARLQGAGAVVVAGRESDGPRLALARRLGAAHAVSADEALEVVRGLFDGLGADVVVDAAGASEAFGLAMEAVRPMGRIVKVGWGPEPLGRSLDPLVRKAATVTGSFSHTYRTWERVVELLGSGALDPRPLIGMELGLEAWRTGFDAMRDGEIVKAVLRP